MDDLDKRVAVISRLENKEAIDRFSQWLNEHYWCSIYHLPVFANNLKDLEDILISLKKILENCNPEIIMVIDKEETHEAMVKLLKFFEESTQKEHPTVIFMAQRSCTNSDNCEICNAKFEIGKQILFIDYEYYLSNIKILREELGQHLQEKYPITFHESLQELLNIEKPEKPQTTFPNYSLTIILQVFMDWENWDNMTSREKASLIASCLSLILANNCEIIVRGIKWWKKIHGIITRAWAEKHNTSL